MCIVWKIEGHDTFSGENYEIPGEFMTEDEAVEAARKRILELEVSQPTEMSGGQFDGIQDRVCIVRPDNTRYLYMTEGKGTR